MKSSVHPSELLYSQADLEKIRDSFFMELIRTRDGEKTSLPFVEHPIPAKAIVRKDELFQVMVIGGTKFETALLKKSADNVLIVSHQKGIVPQFRSMQIFCEFFRVHLNTDVATVALNFAWGLKPVLRNNLLDGIRLSESAKEHTFRGLYGKAVGQELENYVYKTQKRHVTVSCANDTICLLLSDLDSHKWQVSIAGVVGSGINFSFFLNENMAVNLESSNFDQFNQSETGRKIDYNSLNKNRAIFEKETAGAYLYKHFNLLTNRHITSTEQLSDIALSENKNGEIARLLLEKSASLIACQISGIYLFKKEKRLTFIIEGSLFWHGWHYQEFVKKYLHLLDVPENGISFVKIKDSGIVGAARLVTGA